MNKISKKFNKIFAFSLLFLSFPALAMAQCAWWDLGCWLGWLVTLIFRIPIFFFALGGVFLGVVALIMGLIVVPPIVNTLILLGLNDAIYSPFSTTWGLVRNFALSLVRIFLLIVGLMTIFRVREYEARRTLVSFLIGILLISFSFSIVTQIIRWGNVFTNYVGQTFFGVGGGGEYLPNVGNIYRGLLNALLNHFGKIWNIFTIDGDLGKFFTRNLFIIILISISYWIFAFLSIYVSFVLIALGIVFLIRVGYLVCLLIVSPIAFLTFGLRTKEVRQIFGGFLNWEGWWPKFLEWVFIGIVLMIWLGVAVKIFDALTAQVAGKTLNVDCSKALSGQDASIVAQCNEEVSLIANQMLSFIPAIAAAIAIHIGVTTAPGMIKQAVQGIIGAVTLLATAVIAAATAALTAGASAAASATAAGASRLGAAGAFLRAGVTEGGRVFTGSLAKGLPQLKEMPEEFKPGVEMVGGITRRIPWARRPLRALIYEREDAEKEVERTYKEKGAKGVEEIVKSPIASPVLKSEGVRKLLKENKLSDELIESEDFQRFLRTKEGSKYQKDVLKLRVDLAPQFINPQTNRPFRPEDIIKEMTPADVIKIRPRALIVPEVVSAMNPEQADTIIRRGSVSQKEALAKGYAEMLRREANVVVDTTTPERLRNSMVQSFPTIQSTIDRLRRSPHPEDVNRAETIRRVGNRILDRRLSWY